MPSSIFMHMSTTDLNTPHMLPSVRLICCAKSLGLYVCVLTMAWLFGSLGWVRETKPSLS